MTKSTTLGAHARMFAAMGHAAADPEPPLPLQAVAEKDAAMRAAMDRAAAEYAEAAAKEAAAAARYGTHG